MLASLPETERLKQINSLDEQTQAYLAYDWSFWARPSQLMPVGSWVYWLILAGRGFGKTRTGAETVRLWAKSESHINLIGATADDARDIMIEGESGILAVCPNEERPDYRKSERKLIWPNGSVSLIFTADEPDRLRGKQHGKLWADELAAWRYPEAWDQAMFGLRLGESPQAIITTTPRPTKVIRELMAHAHCHVTRGSTRDNAANLSPVFFNNIVSKYEGTRLGRQELDAEILDELPGALWSLDLIDRFRIMDASDLPEMQRVVVGVDPSGADDDSEDADMIGIVVGGLGTDGHGYIFEDLTLSAGPATWGKVATSAYDRHGADRVVGEKNYGGAMVEHVIRTAKPEVAYRGVTATRGKTVRAEPAAALYEQGKVHHIGKFDELEDEMCDCTTTGFKGVRSPNRLDALVWVLTELFPGIRRAENDKEQKKDLIKGLGLDRYMH